MYLSENAWRELFFSRRVKFDSGINVMAVNEVSWHGPAKIIIASLASGSESWGGIGRDPPDWSKKIFVTFSSTWSPPYQGGYSTSEPNGTVGPWNGSPKRLSYGVFPSDKRSWMFRREVFSIPRNLPTNIQPDLIATVPQMYLISLCVLLSQQSHFPICVVSTFNDSKKDLHMIQCKWLWASYLAPRHLQDPCFVRSFLCMDTDPIRPIKRPSPATRLQIDDCFEIHNFHWELCDLLYSNHQKFSARYGSANASSARGPCDFDPFSRSRNFGL